MSIEILPPSQTSSEIDDQGSMKTPYTSPSNERNKATFYWFLERKDYIFDGLELRKEFSFEHLTWDRFNTTTKS